MSAIPLEAESPGKQKVDYTLTQKPSLVIAAWIMKQKLEIGIIKALNSN